MAKILVVGGAGYIGSHMVLELLKTGFEPIVFDNLSSGHTWAVPERLLIRGDLADVHALHTLFHEHTFDAVMHFASFIQVGESVVYPLKYYQNNISNTLNLLSEMEKAGVRRFVFSSTAAVYGTPSETPIPESARLAPENPYGHSKLMVEQVLSDCGRAWGLKSACLRYFNAAGAHPDGNIGEAHEPETHIIPLILKVVLGERPFFTINGNDYETDDGTCIRDYIHVCDLASAHSKALHLLFSGDGSFTCNLGIGHGYSVYEVIEACRKVTGRSLSIKIGPRRQGDPAKLVASADKAIKLLSWQPRYSDLETIVATAWNWHRKGTTL